MSHNQIIQFPLQIRTFTKSLSEHPLIAAVAFPQAANRLLASIENF